MSLVEVTRLLFVLKNSEWLEFNNKPILYIFWVVKFEMLPFNDKLKYYAYYKPYYDMIDIFYI